VFQDQLTAFQSRIQQARFEVLMAVNNEVMILWAVKLSRFVAKYFRNIFRMNESLCIKKPYINEISYDMFICV
jgi:hypothetical protein